MRTTRPEHATKDGLAQVMLSCWLATVEVEEVLYQEGCARGVSRKQTRMRTEPFSEEPRTTERRRDGEKGGTVTGVGVVVMFMRLMIGG